MKKTIQCNDGAECCLIKMNKISAVSVFIAIFKFSQYRSVGLFDKYLDIGNGSCTDFLLSLLLPTKRIDAKSGGSRIIYRTTTPNDRMLEVAKCLVQENANIQNDGVLKVSEKIIIPKPLIISKIPQFFENNSVSSFITISETALRKIPSGHI